MEFEVDLSIPKQSTDTDLKNYSVLQIALASLLLLAILGAGLLLSS